MEIPYGYCQCGCGQKTEPYKQTRTKDRCKKGEPHKFIKGHYKRPQKMFHSRGYELVRMPEHPRNTRGKVLAHIVTAERAFGKPLPPGVIVHHFPSINHFTNLVICQDSLYHQLLHTRHRALIGCGNPNLRKCKFCKQFDLQSNLRHKVYGGYSHPSCHRTYCKNRRKKLKNSSNLSPDIVKKYSKRFQAEVISTEITNHKRCKSIL